jgi:hypothetical protein
MENSGVSKTSKCARSRRVLSLILGSAFAVWAADPVLGTWELNVAKSKYDPGPAPKVDSLQTMLVDHEGNPAAICRHGDRAMHSISGYIAEPAKGLLHIRRGHGCEGHWQSYQV